MKKAFICIILTALLVLTGCNTKATSVLGANINENGELIITYSDGSEQNLGKVVGQDGKDGVDGKDGADGKDGTNGKDGVDGKDGTNGKDGVDGKDGTNGKDGKNGVDGKDGKDGKDGIDGIADSTIPSAVSKALKSAVSVWCPLVNRGSGTSTMQSTGAGVIYSIDKESGDAFIVTNYHVVYNSNREYEIGICENIKVYLYGDQSNLGEISATFIGGSVNNDIAVLKITDSDVLKNSDAIAADIANSDNVSVGEHAIAIGNPEGEGISATVGVISVDSEYLDIERSDGQSEVSIRVIRMDTPVNHGNSGGGLFNDQGKLIGIVNAKRTETGVDDFGYAIPSTTVVALVENILDNCYNTDKTAVRKAMLGVTVSSTNFRAEYNDETGHVTLKEDIIVVETSAGGLAHGTLMADDIILSAQVGTRYMEFSRQYQLLNLLLYARSGDTVYVTVLRGDQTITFDFTITENNLVEY